MDIGGRPLKEQVPEVQRSLKLRKLLEALVREDSLFSYNVPASLRASYDDDSLVAYLRNIYQKPFFVVEEADEIEKHIAIGDRVLNKEEYKLETAVLETNSQVSIAGIEGKQIHIVGRNNISWEVPLEELFLAGEIKRHLLFGDEILPYTPMKPMNTVDDAKAGIHVVHYLGPKRVKHERDCIPRGADGLVLKINKSSEKPPLSILWSNMPGLVQTFANYYGYVIPQIASYYKDIKLVRPNTLNFEQLYHKYMHGEE